MVPAYSSQYQVRRFPAVWILHILGAGLIFSFASTSLAKPQTRETEVEPKSTAVQSDSVLHDGFEGDKPVWVREEVDAPVDWLTHDRSEEAAREGTRSERFVFKAGPGSGIYASYAVPKIKIAEDLSISLHTKADHPGITLLARIIFPADKDPDTGKPSFVVVSGSSYSTTGTWQRLTLTDFPTEMERQARLLRIRTQRKVSTEGAYLERVILNLYGGPGETTVFIDDLRIAPVEPKLLEYTKEDQQMAAEDAAIRGKAEPRLDARRVVIDAGQLKRDGLGWIFSVIDAPGARSDQLLRVGFDVLSVSPSAPPEFLVEASQLGYMLSPRISQGRLVPDDDPENAVERARKFRLPEAVAFWDVGRNLGLMPDNPSSDRQLERNRRLVGLLHETAQQAITENKPFSDIISGSVAGRYSNYALTQNNLMMMGIDPTGWSAGKSTADVLAYFTQRRNLAVLSSRQILYWAWISARSEPAVVRQLWGNDLPPAWGYPRRLPEQVRIDAFSVFSAGFKGWGVKGDADLTRDAGRSTLLELAFLNEEFDLIESFLSTPNGEPMPIDTHPPDPPFMPAKNGISDINAKVVVNPERKAHDSIRGVAFELPQLRGRLLLIADYHASGQWQPPQMAVNNLTVRVPGAAENSTAWLITPGEVRVLERKRAPGGIQIVIPEFDTTAIVMLSSDDAMGQWLATSIARNRAMASTMAMEQAERQYNWVVETHNRLTNAGEVVNDAELWLSQSQERLLSARDAQAREDFGQAWNEARRALRPLRILMHEHWTKAMRNFEAAARLNLAGPTGQESQQQLPILFTPTSNPGLMAFNTLPQAHIWTSWIRDGQFTGDAVQAGSFDDTEALKNASWVNLSRELQGRRGTVAAAGNGDGPGKVLRLNVAKISTPSIDEQSAFVDHPVAAVRTHPVKVNPREMVRIRVRVRMPRPQQPGAGGLVVEDSLGGPALAFRRSEAIPEWSEVVLYRRVGDERQMTVTLGLAGDGDAFFDDLRVERLTENAPLDPARIAARDREALQGETRPATVPAEPAGNELP